MSKIIGHKCSCGEEFLYEDVERVFDALSKAMRHNRMKHDGRREIKLVRR